MGRKAYIMKEYDGLEYEVIEFVGEDVVVNSGCSGECNTDGTLTPET